MKISVGSQCRYLCLAAGLLFFSTSGFSRDYEFDGAVSEPVLRNYLARAVTFSELLNADSSENQFGSTVENNVRMLKNIGAKFAGRAIFMWGQEGRLPALLKKGKVIAEKIHSAMPDMVLQSAAFEIVSTQVGELSIPAWVFEAYDVPVEHRKFRYDKMLYPDGVFHDHWRRGASVPDMSQLETRLWFFYLTASYIQIGVEAIHFGQVELMNRLDPGHRHWRDMMRRVRQFAHTHARRHFVFCDAHVPSGGIVHDGQLMFDFHSFPLRMEEVSGTYEEAVLQFGHFDSLYGRSRGGVTPSGWSCESLPFLVEFDNFGTSGKEGQNLGAHWIWGYDEIGWFARQPEAYRNLWLHYAWNWIRLHDENAYLQMPCSRVLHYGVKGLYWYHASTPCPGAPDGFNQEKTIKQIWLEDRE
jgi:hypothetical protein